MSGNLLAGTLPPQTVMTNANGVLIFASLPIPVLATHTFNYWQTSTGGPQITGDLQFTADSTIRANWWRNATVTFNPNGGVLPAGVPNTATTGVMGRLNSFPLPTHQTLVFNGWFTAATGGDRVLATRQFTGNTTIFAQWVTQLTPPFVISLNPTGGTVSSSTRNTNSTTGQITQTLPIPVKAGYRFTGWFTEEIGGTPITTGSANGYVFTNHSTIYAQWTPGQIFTVTLDPTGGTLNNPVRQTDAYGIMAALSTPTRAGWTFQGWFTAPSGGEQVTASREYTADTTIYAQWREGLWYTVTINRNGGYTVTMPPQTAVATSSDGTLAFAPDAANTGLVLLGWFTAASGGEQIVFGDGGTVFTRDSTIFAQWGTKPGAPFTITLDTQGGTFSAGSVTSVLTDTAGRLTTLPVNPTRTGYTFAGWRTEPNGGGVQAWASISGGTEFDGDSTIYAMWNSNLAIPEPLPIESPPVSSYYNYIDIIFTKEEIKLP
jgi:uncharacterized repeat protein (TIGR02543 family)